MFINIGEYREALGAVLLSAFLGQRAAQNIADGFGAIMIAAALAQAIQRVE